MPKKIIKKIEREYERKGKTKNEAKKIAYKTLNKRGLLNDKKRKGKWVS